jgi:PAS domain S-box-containing protein
MEIDQKASDTTENRRAFLNDEVYYKDIVEGQTELICRFNSDNHLTFVNDAYCNYFQLKRKDLIGQRFVDVIHEDDRDIFQALLSSLDRKNPVATAECRVTLPNRDVHWQQWTIRAIFDDKGMIVAYQTVGRDVTERVLAEADLRDSENNFRTLAENANDGIILIGAKGNVMYVNRCFAETSGYNLDELLTFGFEKLTDPSEREILADRLRRRLKGENVSQNYETNIVRKDGKIVPIEVSASKTIWHNQTAVLGIYRDISARKKRDEEQKQVRDELEHLVDERTSKLAAAAEEMELKHQELLDTNKALTALARNIDREREDAENKIVNIVRSRMLPLLEDFQKNASFKKYRAEIDELMLCLHELNPGLKKGSDIILSLSATELRIATMIKNGLTSPDIADLLHITLDTVKSHRRNIRRKLKLNNSRINLASYLEAKM